MRHLWKALHKIADYGTLLGFCGMIIAVTIQVTARFLLPSAPSWTEELSRMCFMYAVAFGVAAGIKNGAFVRLELLKSYLPEKVSKSIEIIIQWVIILFAISTLYYCISFLLIGMNEQSPSLKISMSVIFASMFVLMFSIAVFSFEQLQELRNQLNKE